MDRHAFARQLRRDSTRAEHLLWLLLRNHATGFKFRRQVPRGPYTLDFACLSHRLVIELDGSQHLDSATDAIRDAWLAARGFRVLRFSNQALLENSEAVLYTILESLGAAPR